MTAQLSIFDQPAARPSDPETSHMAAVAMIGRAETHRLIALRALVAAGDDGLTDFELSDIAHIPQTSIGVRRGELVKAGLVERSCTFDAEGVHPRRRPAPSGSPAAVWQATPAGCGYLTGQKP